MTRRHREVDRADAVGRALGQRRIGLAVIADAGAHADQIHLHVQVGREAVGDRHGDLVGRPGHGEPRRRHDAGAAHAEHALGRIERRLDQELGGVAGLVLLGVGDERDLLLLDLARGRGLAARHPHRQLGAVLATLIIDDDAGDLVLAALGGGERAQAGVGGRRQRARLRVFLGLDVRALLVLPVEPHGLQLDRPTDQRLAVEIHVDGLDLDGLALVDVRPLGAHADVMARRVDEQRRRRVPRLAVDVGDAGVGADAVGRRRVHAEEVEVQDVSAGGVGLARVLPALGLRVAAAVVPPPSAPAPPRHPLAEREVVAVGRRERGLVGGEVPVDVGAREAATGEVARVHRDVGAAADHLDRVVGLGAHLVLGATELLDLEAVIRRATDAALGLELDRRVAEVGRLGQLERQIEAAERADLHRALGQLVADRIDHAVRHRRHLAGDAGDVAALAILEHPQPALHVDVLAGAVHLAIVGDVPHERLTAVALHPLRLVAPPAVAVGDKREVAALLGDQHAGALHRARRQRQHRGAVVAGLAGDAPGLDRQRRVGDRRAIGEVVHPRVQLAAIHRRVDAEAGRLHPRHQPRRLVALFPRRRLDDGDDMAEAAVETRRQIDRGLDQLVVRALHAHQLIEHFLAGQARLLPLPLVVEVVAERGVVRRRDLVELHRQRVVVGREHVEGRVARAGVEHHQPRRAVEVRVRLAGLPRELGVLAERLAELIDDAARHHRAVAGLARGQALHRDVVAVGGHRHPRDLRRRHHLRGVEAIDLERVVELDVERRARRAIAPAALGLDDAQRRIGVEAEALGVGGLVGTFLRRRARADRNLDVGVLGERLGRGERQPAAVALERLGRVDQALHRVVLGDLVGGEQPRRVGLARGLDLDRRQHRGLIDLLVEAHEHRRVELLRTAGRPAGLDPRRRRGERELLRVGEHVARRALRALRDLDRVGRGLREPHRRIEHDRLGAEPAPAPRRRRRQRHRHVARRVVLRRHRDHRLRERQLQLRRQRDVTLGRPPQDRQRLARVVGRRRRSRLRVRRRERALDRLARARRRRRPIAQREGLRVVGLHADRRDAIEDRLGRGVVDRLRRGQRRSIRRRRAGLAVGQPHRQARLVIEHQRLAAGRDDAATAAAGRPRRGPGATGREKSGERRDGDEADRRTAFHGGLLKVADQNAPRRPSA